MWVSWKAGVQLAVVRAMTARQQALWVRQVAVIWPGILLRLRLPYSAGLQACLYTGVAWLVLDYAGQSLSISHDAQCAVQTACMRCRRPQEGVLLKDSLARGWATSMRA